MEFGPARFSCAVFFPPSSGRPACCALVQSFPLTHFSPEKRPLSTGQHVRLGPFVFFGFFFFFLSCMSEAFWRFFFGPFQVTEDLVPRPQGQSIFGGQVGNSARRRTRQIQDCVRRICRGLCNPCTKNCDRRTGRFGGHGHLTAFVRFLSLSSRPPLRVLAMSYPSSNV